MTPQTRRHLLLVAAGFLAFVLLGAVVAWLGSVMLADIGWPTA